MKTIDDLKRETARIVRDEHDKRLVRDAREERDAPILDAFDRLASGRPSASEATAPQRHPVLLEAVAAQYLVLHGPPSVPVVVEIHIAEGPEGAAQPWDATRIAALGEIDVFAKRHGGSMFAQLRALLNAQGFEILAYQSLGSSSHHEHQVRVGKLARRG